MIVISIVVALFTVAFACSGPVVVSILFIAASPLDRSSPFVVVLTEVLAVVGPHSRRSYRPRPMSDILRQSLSAGDTGPGAVDVIIWENPKVKVFNMLLGTIRSCPHPCSLHF